MPNLNLSCTKVPHLRNMRAHIMIFEIKTYCNYKIFIIISKNIELNLITSKKEKLLYTNGNNHAKRTLCRNSFYPSAMREGILT